MNTRCCRHDSIGVNTLVLVMKSMNLNMSSMVPICTYVEKLVVMNLVSVLVTYMDVLMEKEHLGRKRNPRKSKGRKLAIRGLYP